MRALVRAVVVVAVSSCAIAASASAQEAKAPTFATPGPCTEGRLPGGALSLYCVPKAGWNGNLVVFAHGYVSPFEPLTFAHLDLPDGTKLPDLIQTLGFAFATTTYRQNGLSILEGVEDILELVKGFPTLTHGPPARVYLTGASEGALVSVLAVEQQPETFDAAFATCGPVGNFLFQINYVGDARVLFDAYFPGVLPGSPVEIPGILQAGWDKVYAPAVVAAVKRSPARARDLLTVARVPHDAKDVSAMADILVQLLWYNVFGTNDAKLKLGGNPYGNRLRWYSGSTNDVSLNLRVKRIDPDVPALMKLQRYTPTGDLRSPLVSMHTTGDPIVPYAHELVLAAKARPTGRGRLVTLPVFRQGHCAFTTSEILAGFALMLGMGQATMPLSAPVAESSPLPVLSSGSRAGWHE
jgi:hypothetical protein